MFYLSHMGCLQLSKTKQNAKTVVVRLLSPINAHQNANQKSIGGAPAYQAVYTLPQSIYQTLLSNFSRVWLRDYPPRPNWAIVGQGGDLTNCPYSGADPVIKLLEKDGRLLGFDTYSLTMQSEVIKFPMIGWLLFSVNPRTILINCSIGG